MAGRRRRLHALLAIALAALPACMPVARADDENLIGLLNRDRPGVIPANELGEIVPDAAAAPLSMAQLDERRELRDSLRRQTAQYELLTNQVAALADEKRKIEDEARRYSDRAAADADARVRQAEVRRSKTDKLQQVRNNLPEVEKIVANLTSENYAVTQQVKQIQEQYDELIKQYTGVAAQLREHPGFENWLDKRTQQYSPLLHQTLLKASHAAEPVIRGFQKVERLNEQLSESVATEVDRLVPMVRDSPFYSGILFYLILLFPLVVVVWVLQQIRETLVTLTISHYMFLGNLYFALIYVALTVMSLTSHTDVLNVFRQRNQSAFELFLISHMMVYWLHCLMHVGVCLRIGNQKHLTEAGAMCLCGYHFFHHVFRPAMMNKDPSGSALIYIVYSMIFGLVATEKGTVS